jgi:hypothetical protein
MTLWLLSSNGKPPRDFDGDGGHIIRRESMRLAFCKHNKVFVHEVDGLKTTLDKLPFPEQMNEPKALALG